MAEAACRSWGGAECHGGGPGGVESRLVIYIYGHTCLAMPRRGAHTQFRELSIAVEVCWRALESGKERRIEITTITVLWRPEGVSSPMKRGDPDSIAMPGRERGSRIEGYYVHIWS